MNLRRHIRPLLKPLLRSRVFQLGISALSGSIIGFIFFIISRVTGPGLFILTGGIAGAAAAVVLQVYRRAAHLVEVRVSIPQLSELKFLVNNDARQVAWKCFIETVTRVSTQPLEGDDGLIREALTSLYGLFTTIRQTLKESRPSLFVSGSQTVEYLAVTMLNRELRPFLSKWHPRLRAHEQTNKDGTELAWPEAAECRSELRSVQRNLRVYALGFARLANVRDAEEMINV